MTHAWLTCTHHDQCVDQILVNLGCRTMAISLSHIQGQNSATFVTGETTKLE